jgi:hypothetical protein
VRNDDRLTLALRRACVAGPDKEPQVILVQKCWRRKVARRKIHELGKPSTTSLLAHERP